MTSDPRVVVIGAGMSGILCGIRLREAGIDDFVAPDPAARQIWVGVVSASTQCVPR